MYISVTQGHQNIYLCKLYSPKESLGEEQTLLEYKYTLNVFVDPTFKHFAMFWAGFQKKVSKDLCMQSTIIFW